MDVKRRSVLAAGAAGAAGIAGVLGGATSARAVTTTAARPTDKPGPESDSLRDLAAAIGLRVGSAIIPQDLNTPAWAAIAASQFSVVTPGNEMKWQVVEPTQGVFDWTGADNLIAFAKANDQLVRGHTLCWHNQLPTWLTTGVSNGTISSSQLRSLLQQHIYT